jgi:SPP1 family predicted phage head-tail adaptor
MIGKMRHRLTLQEKIRTADGGGGFLHSWENITAQPVVYAAIETLPLREAMAFRQVSARATHKIHLHYRQDITTEMRLISDTKVYHILSVADPGETQTYLEILAESRSA